jgi:(4S)-4-hydroxy-5-phosphonooxypentane-2,3-dione isomerase
LTDAADQGYSADPTRLPARYGISDIAPIKCTTLWQVKAKMIIFKYHLFGIMIATMVHIWVKPGHISAFVEATLENHRHSVREAGNLRFDVLQDASDPSKFVLYEAYASEEAAAAHKETGHYKVWRDRVGEWMEHPRKGEKHLILAPVA